MKLKTEIIVLIIVVIILSIATYLIYKKLNIDPANQKYAVEAARDAATIAAGKIPDYTIE